MMMMPMRVKWQMMASNGNDHNNDDDGDGASEMASNGNGPTAREKFQWRKRAVMTKLLSFENRDADDGDDGDNDDNDDEDKRVISRKSIQTQLFLVERYCCPKRAKFIFRSD